MKSFLKKTITLFVLCTLTFNIAAPAVDAQIGPVPVSDAEIRSKEVGLTVFGVTLKGITYDSVMIAISKKLLERMSDDIVQWINNGFNDGPAFATDPAKYFLTIADTIAGDFIQDIGAGALCSPFKSQIEGALRISYNSSRVTRDQYAGSCSLSGIAGNIDEFFNGDFAQGGWEGWITMTQNQDSNPYGAMITAQSTLAARIASATGIADKELSWSKGFLSSQDCKGEGSERVCVTTTPGSVIENQLQKILGSEISQLELADEFDEIVSALVGQLVGVVFNSGKGLIASNGTQNRWSNGGYGDNRTNSVYQCTPDKNAATLDAGKTDIKWTVYGNSSSAVSKTYLWTGSAPISGTTEEVTITYTTPGMKTAFVTVTETIMTNGTASTVTRERVACQSEVEIKKYPPISGICFPIEAIKYNPAFTYEQLRALKLNATRQEFEGSTVPVRWIVFPKGGSGVYDDFIWRFNKYWPTNKDETVSTQLVIGSVPLHSVSAALPYRGIDTRTASVKIFDKEINEVDVLNVSCDDLEVY